MGLFSKKHSIGKTIAELRKGKGWTQADLAEKLQVSDKAVSKWEKDSGAPSIEFFPLLAELFGVSIDYLMTGKETKKEVIAISKLELCAKNDDLKLYRELIVSPTYKDESGKSIYDYVFQYESKEIFKYLLTQSRDNLPYQTCNEQERRDFCEKWYFMRLVCNDETIVRDFVRLEYVNSTINYHLTHNVKDFIRYNGRYTTIPRKIVSDRMIDYILYSNKISSSLKEQLLSNYKDRNYYAPAFSFPYFIDYAVKKGDLKLAEKLIDLAIKYNDENKAISTNEYTQIYKWIISLDKITFEKLLDLEAYDLIEKANKITFVVDSYTLTANKIKHNKKLSDKDKAIQLCIHDGIVCLDELIALNDFDLYEKMLAKYPISVYETLYSEISQKEYKSLFSYATEKKVESLIDDLRKRNTEKLTLDLQKSIKSGDLEQELNYKYIAKFVYSSNPLRNSCNPTYEAFKSAKNFIFLLEVLDKNIGFIEKASKLATQKELDDALTKISPENFKGISILLKAGAKLHKTWCEDDGWGYNVQRDEIDEIGTEILKKKIKDILGE